MTRSRSKIVYFFVLVILLSLTPAVIRTLAFAKNASGLIILASISDDIHSFNPWHRDFYLVTPDMAMWLLESVDWSFRDTNLLDMPPLHYAVAAHSSAVFDRKVVNQSDVLRMEKLIKLLIARGEPIDEYRDDTTPLLASVLFCDPGAVTILIDAGADLTKPIIREDHETDGMNALQYSAWLEERASSRDLTELAGCRKELRSILENANVGT